MSDQDDEPIFAHDENGKADFEVMSRAMDAAVRILVEEGYLDVSMVMSIEATQPGTGDRRSAMLGTEMSGGDALALLLDNAQHVAEAMGASLQVIPIDKPRQG
jgi:hypothetical protein